MKAKFYIITLIASAVLTLLTLHTFGQVSGSVFRDINNDGVRQTSNPTEPMEFGVVVKAYDAGNTLVATTTTNSNGQYSFSAGQTHAGLAVRIEFTVGAGDQPSKRMSARSSNIQFVVAGPSTNNIDFAIASRRDFSNDANPYVATTAYTNGEANSSGAGSPGDNDNLIVFPYDLTNNGGSTRRAANKHLGAVFGLGWQRESRTLFMSAYLKRHAGFGPGGIGAIYVSQISQTGVPTTPTMLIDVNAIGINVGTNPRTGALPTTSITPNTDDGVFAEVGKRGIGGMDLTNDGRDLYLVNMYEKKLHRITVGNPLKASYTASDVTGTWNIPNPGIAGTEWRPMAVEIRNGFVYIGGVTAKETTTAHNMADTVGMRAIVYEFNPNSGAFRQVLNFSLTYRRGFTNGDFRYENRNNYWAAWQNNGDISLGGPLRAGLNPLMLLGSNATGIYYAQPMLCNIEFDVDGSMILGIRDRFGDQSGYANLFETGNGFGETYRSLTTGEMLRAGRTGTTWAIENHGSVNNNGTLTTTLGLTANNTPLSGLWSLLTGTPWGGSYGPGGGYFYYNQNFSTVGVPAPFNSGAAVTGHYVKSNGGIAVYPGYNEVMMTAIDPETKSYTNGIIRNFNAGSNAGNMSGRRELIVSLPNDPTNMGKAAALGDLELLLDAESMEIGNIVWDDANHNGLQDAHETGMANVVVVLRSPGVDGVLNTSDDQTWTVTTDADGNYYFDETIVNDARRPATWIGVSSTNSGILPGFEYKVEIDPNQPALLGFFSSYRNRTRDDIDSDGSLDTRGMISAILNPGGSTSSASTFANDYNIDFGFTNTVLAVHKLDLFVTLADNTADIKWNTTEEKDVKKYFIERSLDGKEYATIGSVNSKGDGSFNYRSTDNLNGVTVPVVYYRLRIADKDNKVTYTTVVRVNLSNSIKMTVGPNPFINTVNIQIAVAGKTQATVRIFNTSGQTIYQHNLSLDKGMTSFAVNDLQNFARGMYVVEVQAGQTIERQKLLRQ